jgi:Asp-tRNA(Asn)/Glu-tRNA(Gln) amidotransferase A subunit family amidase
MSPELMGAAAAVRAIRAGELSAVELTGACLRAIERFEPDVLAWEVVEPARALVQAAEVDRRLARGEDVGPLAGVPVGVKDIFNTMDMPTQMGSPIWAGFTPGNDARVVHYLRMAGAVIPGKTVTAEFAVHTPGKTRNPHDPRYMTGTSSSGSAAAVAAYMVPLALGTQTAGSTIRPASYCGVYGFKPSFGLVPRTGMLKTTDSLDTVGGFARCAEDLRLLFDVVRVHGEDYPIASAALGDPSRQRRGDRPWRIGVVQGPRWEHAEPYAREKLQSVADRLADAGIVVEYVVPPAEIFRAHEVHATIYDKALAYYFREEFAQQTLVSPVMYEIVERGNRIPPDRYRAALAEQAEIARSLDVFLADGPDALITLSTGGEPLLGLDSVDRPDSCLVWTLCGAPTVGIPAFAGPSGLPFGLQLVGRRYNDYLLLDLVEHLEEIGIAPRTTHPAPPMVAAGTRPGAEVSADPVAGAGALTGVAARPVPPV